MSLEKVIIIGIFLGIGTIYDLCYKQIPTILFIVFGGIAVLGITVGLWNSQLIYLIGTLPGILFLLLSKASREQIGYGDSLAFIIIGAFGGVSDILYIIVISLILASLISGILFILKRVQKQCSIPFFPLIFIAFLCRNLDRMEIW